MSKEKKWTPGPWFAGPPDYLGMTVARVDKLWSVKCDEPVASGEHDARLIAAAPELYDALSAILEIVSDSIGVYGYHLNGDVAEWGEFPEIEQAFNALANARGES